MSSNNSRKSFIFGAAALIAAAFALPKFLLGKKSAANRSVSAQPAFKVKRDPKTVSRRDSQFI